MMNTLHLPIQNPLPQIPCIPSIFPIQIPTPIFPTFPFIPTNPHRRRIQVQKQCVNSSRVFPGGTRRASVKIPGLGIRIKTEDILGNDAGIVKGILDSSVAAGVNMVVLEDGKEDSLRVYDAARIVMSVLRGRADLLVVERVDIAAAAAANGVVLSDRGLPSVVARRMMQNAMPEAVVLPLVARRVTSFESAENATITEGADMLLLSVYSSTDSSILESICRRVKIPVFLEYSSSLEVSLNDPTVKLLKLGASGIILGSLPAHSQNVPGLVSAVYSNISSLVTKSGINLTVNGDGSSLVSVKPTSITSLEQQAKAIIEEMHPVLLSSVEVFQEASPQMEEVTLLMDAIKQLDDLFLMVVVGEFNSGKSSVINALLGDKVLKQGVLPTTNEITLLKHSDKSYEERPQRHPDGHLMRYLSADLLKKSR